MRSSRKRVRGCRLLLAGTLLLLGSRPVHAEPFLSGYAGFTETFRADVKLQRPGGTDLTFQGVSWDGKSFASPIYYGFRGGYWLGELSRWGVSLEFIHAKLHAEREREVMIHGDLEGVPARLREPLASTFSELSFSHGHNLIVANALYRWFPLGVRDRTFLGRLQPYGGLGLGLALPHVEVTTDGSVTDAYQLTGPVFQVLCGLSVDLFRHLSVFAEYKLTYVRLEAALVDGGAIRLEPWTNHFVFGLTAWY